jgi:hypothetical protein
MFISATPHLPEASATRPVYDNPPVVSAVPRGTRARAIAAAIRSFAHRDDSNVPCVAVSGRPTCG